MLIALLGAAVIAGQAANAPDRTCLDNDGRDVCAQAVRADLLQRLGLPSAEAEAGDGVESYRVFFVDGYGRDLPAFVFERRPGSGPRSVVYGQGGARLEAPASLEIWREVVARAEFADRELVPSVVGREEVAICLHGWTSTVEMTNSPVGRGRVAPVRRRTENACDGALTTRYAFFVAEQTLKAQPQCQGLDPDLQRNTATLIATCVALKGDRIAAGSVHDQIRDGRPRNGLDQTSPLAWQTYMGINGSPRLDWAGQVMTTERGVDRAVAEFIVARLAERPGLRFELASYEGVDSRRVKVTGHARYAEETTDGQEREFQAPFTQTWVWDPNLSQWMLSDWTVQPFSPSP